MHALPHALASLLILGAAAPGRAQPPGTTGTPAAQASPSITLGELNVIRVSAGAASAGRHVLLTLGNLPPGLAIQKPPMIQDTSLDGQAHVVFSDPQRVDEGSTQAWTFAVTVTGLPIVATESHVAALTVGGRIFSRPYSLTNRPAGATTWSVTPPGVPWIVSWGSAGSPLTLNVMAQDAPIEQLKIAQSTLRDAQNLTQIDRDDLELVPDKDYGLSVPAHTARPFDIHLRRRSAAGPHGKFTGSVQLTAGNMPDLQSATVTLYVSSIWMRLAGALLIWIGLTLSEQLVHRIRPRIARAQALRPVIAARKAALDLTADLAGLVVDGVTFSFTLARLRRLASGLSTHQLDAENLLPARVDVPFGTAVDATARLQERLTSTGVELTAIATLIRHGFRQAIADLAFPTYTAAEVKQALADLDRLGDTVASAADALAKVPPILDTYRRAGARAAAAGIAQAAAADPITLDEANAIVEHESRAGWAIVKAVTLFTGVMLLVLPNAGFAWIDLAYCLAWGLGLPTAGAALQSLTPIGVSTSLGVSVPRG